MNQPVCPVLNHHRDGQLQHRVHKGSVNYWPNRFEAIPPAPTEKTKFDKYPEKLEGIKARLKSEKFKEHINQAQLFYNSLKSHEQAHLQAALGFELDHCEDPVVRNCLIFPPVLTLTFHRSTLAFASVSRKLISTSPRLSPSSWADLSPRKKSGPTTARNQLG